MEHDHDDAGSEGRTVDESLLAAVRGLGQIVEPDDAAKKRAESIDSADWHSMRHPELDVQHPDAGAMLGEGDK
jgi:hypothetical protein